MSAIAKRIEFQDRLMVAAGMDVTKIQPSLTDLLIHRKRIAERMLRANTSTLEKEYENLYIYINNQIKLLLGL